MNPMSSRRHTAAGFSLLELMIVVAILGILATIAYPSFRDQIRKSRRSDAYSAVSSILLLQEKYRANHATYGTLAQIGAAASSADGHYDLSVSGQTASGYTVQAAAVSGGSQAGDQEAGTSCATLTVTVAGSNQTHAPAACWRK